MSREILPRVGKTVTILLVVEGFIYTVYLFLSLTTIAESPISVIDKLPSVRVGILCLILVQAFSAVLLRHQALLSLSSLMVVFAYLYWWLRTAQAVMSTELQTYRNMDHFLFLEGANIADLVVLVCALAIFLKLLFSNKNVLPR